MALIYRAIWQDDTVDLESTALEVFRSWAGEKIGADLRLDGDEPMTIDDCEVHARRGRGEQGAILRATLHEEVRDERWTSTLIVLVDRQGPGGWLWVDVERVAADAFGRFQIAAPRLVRSLIDEGLNPRRGPIRMTTRPRAYRPEEVAELVTTLRDPSRDVPVVVFSHHDRDLASESVDRAKRAAHALAGIAVVAMLPPGSDDAFAEAAGDDLAVSHGALRLFLPGLDPTDQKPWRHRVIPRSKFSRDPMHAGTFVGRMLATSVGTRRAPDLYPELRPLLTDGAGLSIDDLLCELEAAEKAKADLQREFQHLQDEQVGLLIDLEEAEKYSNALSQAMAAMQVAQGDLPESEGELPSEAVNCSEAADHCQRYLDRVKLPDAARRDLESLDTANESGAWGESAWRGFRALQAYAEEANGFKGGFFEWCKQTTHPWKWPATQKKISMVESETVLNNERLKSQRVLPVDPVIRANGAILMQAHLKIAQGGGDLAPRIYFHDDSKGVTGMVHVGFFGPHKFMQNTMS